MLEKLENRIIKPKNAYLEATDETKNEYVLNMDQVYKQRSRSKAQESFQQTIDTEAIPKEYLKVIQTDIK